MPICQICQKNHQHLRYSARIRICDRCTNDLNEYHQVASHAYLTAKQWLESGVIKNNKIDITQPLPTWFNTYIEKTLSGWINKILADKTSRSQTHKIIRAHRRGLLHFDIPRHWHRNYHYPENWGTVVAPTIRKLDKFTCVKCQALKGELHVHHIIHVSNFGTHQQANLVTLCRRCHKLEHGRDFDFGENMNITDQPPMAADGRIKE